MNTDMCCWNAISFMNEWMNERTNDRGKNCPKKSASHTHFSERIYDKIILHFIYFFSSMDHLSLLVGWWCFSILWSEYMKTIIDRQTETQRVRAKIWAIKSNAREHTMKIKTNKANIYKLIEMNIHILAFETWSICSLFTTWTTHLQLNKKAAFIFFSSIFIGKKKHSRFKAYYNKHP